MFMVFCHSLVFVNSLLFKIFQIKVFTSLHEQVRSQGDLKLIWKNASIDVNDVFEV
jgi:hypothetical protein